MLTQWLFSIITWTYYTVLYTLASCFGLWKINIRNAPATLVALISKIKATCILHTSNDFEISISLFEMIFIFLAVSDTYKTDILFIFFIFFNSLCNIIMSPELNRNKCFFILKEVLMNFEHNTASGDAIFYFTQPYHY